eukprot:COSAG01_NODE_979_length_12356_cov_224.025618_13_plen_697_part_00
MGEAWTARGLALRAVAGREDWWTGGLLVLVGKREGGAAAPSVRRVWRAETARREGGMIHDGSSPQSAAAPAASADGTSDAAVGSPPVSGQQQEPPPPPPQPPHGHDDEEDLSFSSGRQTAGQRLYNRLTREWTEDVRKTDTGVHPNYPLLQACVVDQDESLLTPCVAENRGRPTPRDVARGMWAPEGVACMIITIVAAASVSLMIHWEMTTVTTMSSFNRHGASVVDLVKELFTRAEHDGGNDCATKSLVEQFLAPECNTCTHGGTPIHTFGGNDLTYDGECDEPSPLGSGRCDPGTDRFDCVLKLAEMQTDEAAYRTATHDVYTDAGKQIVNLRTFIWSVVCVGIVCCVVCPYARRYRNRCTTAAGAIKTRESIPVLFDNLFELVHIRKLTIVGLSNFFLVIFLFMNPFVGDIGLCQDTMTIRPHVGGFWPAWIDGKCALEFDFATAVDSISAECISKLWQADVAGLRVENEPEPRHIGALWPCDEAGGSDISQEPQVGCAARIALFRRDFESTNSALVLLMIARFLFCNMANGRWKSAGQFMSALTVTFAVALSLTSMIFLADDAQYCALPSEAGLQRGDSQCTVVGPFGKLKSDEFIRDCAAQAALSTGVNTSSSSQWNAESFRKWDSKLSAAYMQLPKRKSVLFSVTQGPKQAQNHGTTLQIQDSPVVSLSNYTCAMYVQLLRAVHVPALDH